MGLLGWPLIHSDFSLYKKRIFGYTKRQQHQRRACTEERPCEDTVRRQLSASQGDEASGDANTLILDFQPPQLWSNKSCCLSHPVCILFGQPEVISTKHQLPERRHVCPFGQQLYSQHFKESLAHSGLSLSIY